VTPANFDLVARLVKARSGLVLTPDKVYMPEARLAPLLWQEELPDLDALALQLRGPQSRRGSRRR
jgi:chemotaxis protein methyltransferase CheR